MSSTEQLAPLLDVLRALGNWVVSSKRSFVVIEGVAASLIGQPRFTQDLAVTALVDPSEWERFVAIDHQHGFEGRHPNLLDFTRQNRLLVVRHVLSGIDIDIAFDALPFERQLIRRARLTKVGDLEIPLPTPEDLDIMKTVAHRRRDLDDIDGVLQANPDLDRRRILRWVRDFANVLEMPDLLADLQAALDRHPPRLQRKIPRRGSTS